MWGRGLHNGAATVFAIVLALNTGKEISVTSKKDVGLYEVSILMLVFLVICGGRF